MSKKEKYLIPVEGQLIEVEKEVYDVYYQMDRHARYVEEREQSNGVVSYQSIETKGIDGEAGLIDPNAELIEDYIIVKEMQEQLHQCIALLPKQDRELIHAIYFEGLSPKDYAKRIGLTKRGVNGQRRRILIKMRELMQYWEGKVNRS